jgi:carboxylesterase type B
MMWKFIVPCVLLSNLLCILAACVEGDNVVKISNGCLKGEQHTNYLAFEGIRYAEPPIGENRFEPPKPYTDTWEGVRNATQIGPMCVQINDLNDNKLEGEEDCLFLNVYKPAADSSEEVDSLPVLVHIHGGEFMFGDGGFYGHKHLMKEGKFIYMSFNYRLGALGFLSTNCHLIPGNMGLKDQVLALKWVQENIRAFGGNPNSVTISGFSAGAAAVHLHYMSPMSAGLFHRGISHSDSALIDYVVIDNPFERTISLAEKLNCPHESHIEMVKCLKSKKADDLIRHKVIYAAVKEYEHDNAFITDTPLHYLKEGKIQKLPWLVSATKDEEDILIAVNYENETYWETLNENWNQNLPKILQFDSSLNSTILDGVAEKLRRHYLNGEPVTKKNARKIGKVGISNKLIHISLIIMTVVSDEDR